MGDACSSIYNSLYIKFCAGFFMGSVCCHGGVALFPVATSAMADFPVPPAPIAYTAQRPAWMSMAAPSNPMQYQLSLVTGAAAAADRSATLAGEAFDAVRTML